MDNMFDSGKIKYTDDYQDVIMNKPAKPVFPEWKVYFDGSFWGHHGRDHAGKEIHLKVSHRIHSYRGNCCTV